MSGIEFAGLILSTIPIVLIGLQEVHGRTSRILFKHQHVISSFIRDLNMEHAQFRSTLEKILSGLVDDLELARLLGDQKHPLWKDDQLEKNMKQRIGPEAYQCYITTVNRVAGALAELSDSIGLKHGKKEKWHKEMRNRLKTCIEDHKHTALLEEIRMCNQALRRLTDDTLVLEPLRTSRRGKSDETTKWEFIRKLATSLHQALESGWLCECSTPHLAHLRLERRSEPSDVDIRFGVLFSSASSPRGWRETEIRILKSPEESAVELESKPSPPEARSVSFSPRLASTPLTISPSITTTPALPEIKTWDTKIDDLCCKLKECDNPGHIGFLDDDQHKHYIQVFPSTALAEDISLAEVLSQGKEPGQRSLGMELGLRDKYELAVTLATSVLQLHTTPWLDEQWSNKDVYFVRKRHERSSSVAYAYIQRSFDPPKVRAMSNPELAVLAPTVSRPSVRNETIFALGVSLIELSLGRTLASFQTDADLSPDGKRSYFTDWLIANRLLKEKIAVSEGDRYSKIVNRCINCIFDPLDPSLENAAFRQAFYNNAVVPLEEILVDFVK